MDSPSFLYGNETDNKQILVVAYKLRSGIVMA